MFKNRFLIVLGISSLLLVAMAVSRSSSSTAVSIEGANDFYQRHRDWNRDLEGSDYIERHPTLGAPAGSIVDVTGDFALRHPAWMVSVPNAASPMTGTFEALDYFQRHPELSLPTASAADVSDYFLQHPELRAPATIDLSDYFQRH